jgi:hypothetical protein
MPPNRLIDLAGRRFGAWTVLARAPNSARRTAGARWRCRCACGREDDIPGYNLRHGISTMCRDCRRRMQRAGAAGVPTAAPEEEAAWRAL